MDGHTRRIAAAICVCALACTTGCGGGFAAGTDTQLGFAPERIDLPAIPLGEVQERTVQVWHSGSNGVLHLSDVVFETDSADLSLAGPDSARLEPGETAEWVVRYEPRTVAPDFGTLTIRHNLPQRPPVRVDVESPGQVGILRAEPAKVDFGVLAPGEEATREVTLRNVGSDALDIEDIRMIGDGDGDFVVDVPGGTLGEMPRGETRTLGVTYTPTGWDKDEATLRIRATGREEEIALPVVGREMGPAIAAVPSVVGFGPVAVDASATRSLMLVNQGSGELVVDAIDLAAGAHPALSLGGGSDGPFPVTLAPNDSVFVDVTWAPTEADPDLPEELGAVEVESNDRTQQPLRVPVQGKPGAPILSVSPADVIDFGFVAQGITSTRTVGVSNVGQLPLSVDEIRVVEHDGGELVLVEDPGFGPTADDATPAILPPGESRQLTLRFTNQGGASGSVRGQLRVRSDDSDRPDWRVQLVGRRAGEATCAPSFQPTVTYFGGVAHETSRTVDVRVVNDGTGKCTVQSAWIDHCRRPDGASQECVDGELSQQFTLAGAPPTTTALGPGEGLAIPVRFDAPTFSGSEDGVDRYRARINATILDPQTGEEVVVPRAEGGWEPGPNLVAESGIPRLNVYPDRIDFGFVPTGCDSRSALVNLHAVGPVPVEVTEVSAGLSQCHGAFFLEDAPTVPLSIASGFPESLAPRFHGDSLGEFTCDFSVHSNDPDDPVHPISLRAETVDGEIVTESFEGKSINVVDVLFVVDSSGSMNQEQTNLAANFEAFIETAQEWQTDYQIGVTTMDVGDEGALQGDPEVVTPETWTSFLDNVLVGTSGSGIEKGLATAKASLEGPFGKWVRDDASLVLIFVSDEEDQSEGNALDYLNFFSALKGHVDDLVTAYAIVGPPGGCQSPAGNAGGGVRYITVAEQSGGAFASICDESFSDALTTFGEGTFGPKTSFPLGGTAKDGTVVVEIGGEPCYGGWSLEDGGRGLSFDPEGPCLPDEGDDLAVTYELYCH